MPHQMEHTLFLTTPPPADLPKFSWISRRFTPAKSLKSQPPVFLPWSPAEKLTDEPSLPSAVMPLHI